MAYRKYTIGQYSSFYTLDIGYMVTPKKYDPATVKFIIGCHGHGGSGFSYGLGPLIQHVDALAEAGYIVYGIDHARINSWGDPDAMSAISDAYSFMVSYLGQTGSPKCGIMGWSMGGLTALNWIRKNSTLVSAGWVFNPASDVRYFRDTSGLYTPPYSTTGLSNQGSYVSEINTTYAPSTTANGGFAIPASGGAGITVNVATNGARSFSDGTAGATATVNGFNFTYTGKTNSSLTGCVSTGSGIVVVNGNTISATYAQQIAGYSPYIDYLGFKNMPGGPKLMISQANDDATVPPAAMLSVPDGFIAKVNDPNVLNYGTITGGHVVSLLNTPPTEVVNFYKAYI